MIVRAAALLMGLGLAVSAIAQSKVAVPAGTRILIRMVNSVDSSKQQVGYRFTANLEQTCRSVTWSLRLRYNGLWPACQCEVGG